MKLFASSFIAIAMILSAGVPSRAASAKATVTKNSSHEAKKKTGNKARKKSANGSNPSRDVVFDGSVINGKYLAAGEAVSTVEADKTLSNLIGLRTDFKDRLVGERQRLKSGSQGEK